MVQVYDNVYQMQKDLEAYNQYSDDSVWNPAIMGHNDLYWLSDWLILA